MNKFFPSAVQPAEAEPAVTLLSLSEELLGEIIVFLAGTTLFRDRRDGDDFNCQGDLASLALTNRTLNRIVTPYLYVSLNNFRIDAADLLHSLVGGPSLAELTKNLNWCYSQPDATNIISHPCALTADEHYSLDTELSRLGLQHEVKLMGVSNPITSSDYLAATLLVTQNVKHIDIEDLTLLADELWYHPVDVPSWVHVLSTAGIPFAPHFQHLRTIRISLGPLKLEQISGILLIPSLRSLALAKVCEPFGVELSDWECPDRKSLVEDLSLNCSFIDSIVVTQLLRAFRGLKKFTLDQTIESISGLRADIVEQSGLLHYPILKKGLLEHKATLEYLSIINAADSRFHDTEAARSSGTLGLMGEFMQLRIIHIGIFAFANVQGQPPIIHLAQDLPPNLHHLTVWLQAKHHMIWERALEELAAYKRMFPQEIVPNFKTICSIYHCPSKRAFPSIQQRLDKIGRRYTNKGIEFRLLSALALGTR